ncbi:spermidine synthase [Subtercola sp. YIM 133946]|uniref:spermidine synthase n=1 Tax=Subtercola sp. YIM 133946 TaxID=3118909 RepID=UPI002F94E31F
MTTFPFRTLVPSGLPAEIRPDELQFARRGTAQAGTESSAEPAVASDGFTLYIGGEPQSHVFVEHQTHLLFDYLQRIANVVDLFAPTGEPIAALHLGAGALTLPRYIAITRPDSQQFVLESEENLLDFVTSHLPLPRGTEFTVRTDDARRGLPWAATFGPFDLIVLDVYAGSSTPSHLTTVEFYTQVAAMLSPQGILMVNVADDAGLALVRAQTAALAAALEHVVILGSKDLIVGLGEGNAVLVGSPAPGILDLVPRLAAEGPHPAGIVEPGRLAEFIGDAKAVTDAELEYGA